MDILFKLLGTIMLLSCSVACYYEFYRSLSEYKVNLFLVLISLVTMLLAGACLFSIF